MIDSLNRLSVHTTWLLNFDFVKNSKYGEIATRFVHAAAFLDLDEIHEGLIKPEFLSPDDANEKKRELPLTNNHVVDVLTKFSLFQRKTVGCMRLHRLVQQVIRGTMASKEIATTMCTAFQLLKSATLLAGKSAADMSVFSIIRHWLTLKRHMEKYVEAKADGFQAEELSRLIDSGAEEIVFAVTHTLEGSKQELENHRRLSALLDNDYDMWLGGRELEVERQRMTSGQPTAAIINRYGTRGHHATLRSRYDTLGHQTNLGSRSGKLGYQATLARRSNTLGHQANLGSRSDTLEHQATLNCRSDTLEHQATFNCRSDTLEHQATLENRSESTGT